MKVSEAFPSKYLTADDLQDQDVTVTIASVDVENIGQGEKAQQKLVITFKGKKKAFVCNRTNANTIAKVLGSDDTDDWVGKSIIIGPREVEFRGEMVMSIRVSLKKPATKSPAVAPETDPEGDDPDWS